MSVVWDIPLVLLSVAIAIVGSLTALAHAQRMRTSSGLAVHVWMIAGGGTLGLAIWSMHFIGMLALHLQVPVGYDLSLTLISMLPAIAAALLGFFVLREAQISLGLIVVSSLLMGAGISAMHYLGMAALHMSPPIRYTPLSVTAAILIAILASFAALVTMYRRGRNKWPNIPRLLMGGTTMGLAISSMHYTAMIGTQFMPGSVCLSYTTEVDRDVPATLISLISLFLFGGGILAASFDQRMAMKTAEALTELEHAHSLLQMRTKELAKLAVELNKFRAIIESTNDAIISKTLDSTVTSWNPGAERLYGYTSDEVIGKSMHILYPADRLHEEAEIISRIIQGERVEHLETVRRHKNGQLIDISVTISPIVDETGRLVGASNIARDITQRKQMEEQIKQLAFYDPLTNLPNRRLLHERCKQAMYHSSRRENHGAIMVLDLDRFKMINDIHGHDVGDMLLIEVSRRLRACVRAEDTIARMGGDEFVVLLSELSPDSQTAKDQAYVVAEKIRQSINTQYFLLETPCITSPSIGVCIFQGTEVSVDELFRRADKAMYQAKKAGRNAMHIWSNCA